MNYMYDPKVSAKNWEFMNCANPNDEALKYHSQAYLDDPHAENWQRKHPQRRMADRYRRQYHYVRPLLD